LALELELESELALESELELVSGLGLPSRSLLRSTGHFQASLYTQLQRNNRWSR